MSRHHRVSRYGGVVSLFGDKYPAWCVRFYT